MKDYLEKLCRELCIRLSYTDHDDIILTGSIQDNMPAIMVHRMFRHCPEKVADAIIDYCISQASSNYELIENYARDRLYSLEYVIQPPDEKKLAGASVRKSAIQEETAESAALGEDYRKQPILSEMDISTIKYRDFHGKIKKISADDGIAAPDDSVVELDITVEKPI